MKILAFAGSNSSVSINYQLVLYTASMISGQEVKCLDLSKTAFPLFSIDLEKDPGFPEPLKEFYQEISKADRIVISVNEHNGGPSAFFKNLVDWLSRLDRKFLEGKKVFLMSASPGRKGAMSSRAYAEKTLPYFGAEISQTFSLPGFNQNFDRDLPGITDKDLKEEHESKLRAFLEG